MMRPPRQPAARQGGYMLLLVLVALVAMMISGIALVRSMDTNQLVAGNLAARNAAVHSADAAVQAAVTWLAANSSSGVLLADASASGYYAEESTSFDWTNQTNWAACPTCTTTDAAGNSVSWIVHRMCKFSGSPNGVGQFCATTAGSGSASNGSLSSDSPNFTTPAASYYRITVQVLGPRNTATLTQAYVTF